MQYACRKKMGILSIEHRYEPFASQRLSHSSLAEYC